ncbi:MAG: hypothetical protein IT235_04430, partial [Bacteroidia bacterium]|nr:hypothetical protein [Bacteroidia bacterium]
MNFKFLTIKQVLFSVSVGSLLMLGCSGSNKEGDSDDMPDTDTAKTALLNVNGEIISIPSPIQTAFLINKVGLPFDKQMLNPTVQSTTYSTKFQKALNLGVYGADLGYVTMYDQTQDALAYMNTVKKLGDDLGVSSAFTPALLSRFQANFGKKDSLLGLVSAAYRQSDSYLKNNKQNDISGLILTGGWIETMHFVTNVLKTKDNEEIKRRIGEQKTTVTSIIKLLTPYSAQKEYADLISKMNEISTTFEGI